MLKLANLYYDRLDPLWAVCADLEIPVHRHAIISTESAKEVGDAAPCCSHRNLVLRHAGNLASDRGWGVRAASHTQARHHRTGYRFRNSCLLGPLDFMTELWREFPQHYTLTVDGLSKLNRKPSEYFATNCYVGGPLDLLASIEKRRPT